MYPCVIQNSGRAFFVQNKDSPCFGKGKTIWNQLFNDVGWHDGTGYRVCTDIGTSLSSVPPMRRQWRLRDSTHKTAPLVYFNMPCHSIIRGKFLIKNHFMSSSKNIDSFTSLLISRVKGESDRRVWRIILSLAVCCSWQTGKNFWLAGWGLIHYFLLARLMNRYDEKALCSADVWSRVVTGFVCLCWR